MHVQQIFEYIRKDQRKNVNLKYIISNMHYHNVLRDSMFQCECPTSLVSILCLYNRVWLI